MAERRERSPSDSELARNVAADRRVALMPERLPAVVRGACGVALLTAGIQSLAMWGPQSWEIPDVSELTRQVRRFVGGDSDFAAALLHSASTVGLALLGALAVGVAIGLTLGLSRTAYRAVILLLELLRPVPAVAVIPVMILAFGQGLSMEIVVTIFGAWWPIMFNTLYGVRNVDPVTIETARVFGLTRLQIIRRVVLPSVLPMVITGLRIAAPMALILTVGAEYLATAGQGLGGILIKATSTGDLQVLWAAAVVTGAMGLVLGGLVWVVGRVMCPWSEES